jgi:hypothetical protein
MATFRDVIRFLRLDRLIQERVRRREPAVNPVTAAVVTSISPEEALRSIPTLAKIHNLLATAVNRLTFSVRLLGEELPKQSQIFDYYAGVAFADWYVLGYCVFDHSLAYYPISTYPENLPLSDLIIAQNPRQPIQSAQPILIAAYEYYRALVQGLRNLGAWNFAVISPEVTRTKESVEQLRKMFEDKRRIAGVGGIEFVSLPLNIISVAPEMTKLALDKLSTLINREICDLYGIDSSLLNDPENKTYANKEEGLKALYTHVILPAADQFVESVTRAFVRAGYAYTFVYNTGPMEGLLEDKRAIANTLIQGYNLGVVTKKELRAFFEEMLGRYADKEAYLLEEDSQTS